MSAWTSVSIVVALVFVVVATTACLSMMRASHDPYQANGAKVLWVSDTGHERVIEVGPCVVSEYAVPAGWREFHRDCEAPR